MKPELNRASHPALGLSGILPGGLPLNRLSIRGLNRRRRFGAWCGSRTRWHLSLNGRQEIVLKGARFWFTAHDVEYVETALSVESVFTTLEKAAQRQIEALPHAQRHQAPSTLARPHACSIRAR